MNQLAIKQPIETVSTLNAIRNLISLHRSGHLKGEFMPEDSNPALDKNSVQNAHYFTLPMALNYQRNSYKLWESALKTYQDPETCFVFDPAQVVHTSFEDLQTALVKHKVALQKNKHVEIWQRLCATLHDHYQDNILNLFQKHAYNIQFILHDVQQDNKKSYPYLSGQKIANYWLYVMTNYTSLPFINRQALSVAPDTHIIQATVKLGLVDSIQADNPDRQAIAHIWRTLLIDTDIAPIDIHTPLWLWSRNNFMPDPFETLS